MVDKMDGAAWIGFLRDRRRWQIRTLFVFWFYAVSGIANVLTISTVVWYGFLQPTWLSFTNEPIPVLGGAVVAGEKIVIKLGRCNSSGHSRIYLANRKLIRIDASQPDIDLGSIPVDVREGCTLATIDNIVIPETAHPGRYEIRAEDEANSTWRTAYVAWRTEAFTILATMKGHP